MILNLENYPFSEERVFEEHPLHYLDNLEGSINFNVLVRIPPKSLTSLRFTAIIKRNKGGQDQVDTPKSQRKIFKLLDRIFIMHDFKVKGDMGRHMISISGASAECGISTSTINREVEKGTFPPKQKITGKRISFFVYQIEQWLSGQRGGWN